MDSPIARTSIHIATCACTSAAAPARRLTRKPSASRYPWCTLLRRDGKSSCPRAPRWAITCLGVLPPSSRDLTASRRRSGRKPASGALGFLTLRTRGAQSAAVGIPADMDFEELDDVHLSLQRGAR